MRPVRVPVGSGWVRLGVGRRVCSRYGPQRWARTHATRHGNLACVRERNARALTTCERSDGGGRRARTAVTLPLTTPPTRTAYGVTSTCPAPPDRLHEVCSRRVYDARENTVGSGGGGAAAVLQNARSHGGHAHGTRVSWRRPALTRRKMKIIIIIIERYVIIIRS